MKPRGIVTLSITVSVCACAPEAEHPGQEEQAQTERRLIQDMEREAILAYLEENQSNWVERDGALVCEGYMTRYEDEEFCASEVPDGWRAFEFNGQTFYMQPLAESNQ